MSLVDSLKFDMQGLIPCICQDARSGEVLMMAWMNRESFAITVERGLACYWSRSRQKLWLKGESSGHVQRVVEMRLDCDGDCLLIRVEQTDAACHTGYRSCFYRVADKPDTWREDGVRIVDESQMKERYADASGKARQ